MAENAFLSVLSPNYFNIHSMIITPNLVQPSHFCQFSPRWANTCKCSFRSNGNSIFFPVRTNAGAQLRKRISALTASSAQGASVKDSNSTASTIATDQKKVLVPIGFGTEEMDAVIIIDILRRAGADVTVASVESNLQIQCSSGTKLIADTLISTCAKEIFDLVVLPGGMPGSARLRDSEILRTITRKQAEGGRLYGAISEAPAIALDAWDLLSCVEVTCHPQFTYRISCLWIVTSNVHKDRLLTTSRGPGTAMEFALSFVEQLYGKEKSEEIEKALVMPTNGGGELGRQEYNAVDWTFTNPPSVLVPVANGSEEMETVIIVDILRRASVNVVVASIEEELEILGSRKVKLVADKLIEDAAKSAYDMIILPGGIPGAERLGLCEPLRKLLREQALSNRVYGAICASPAIVLEPQGLLKDKKATAHPSFSSKLVDQSDVYAGVVIDGKLITSKGPGTAMEFSIALIDKLYGHDRARGIAQGMVYNYTEALSDY